MKHATDVRCLVLSCLLPLLFGCGSPTDPETPWVELQTDQMVYVVGEYGMLTVVNRLPARIEIPHSAPNRCGIYGVEGRKGEDWVEVGIPLICQSVLAHLRLGPGESAQIVFRIIEGSYQPGSEYRLRLTVRVGSWGSYTPMYTEGFLVEE